MTKLQEAWEIRRDLKKELKQREKYKSAIKKSYTTVWRLRKNLKKAENILKIRQKAVKIKGLFNSYFSVNIKNSPKYSEMYCKYCLDNEIPYTCVMNVLEICHDTVYEKRKKFIKKLQIPEIKNEYRNLKQYVQENT